MEPSTAQLLHMKVNLNVTIVAVSCTSLHKPHINTVNKRVNMFRSKCTYSIIHNVPLQCTDLQQVLPYEGHDPLHDDHIGAVHALLHTHTYTTRDKYHITIHYTKYTNHIRKLSMCAVISSHVVWCVHLLYMEYYCYCTVVL